MRVTRAGIVWCCLVALGIPAYAESTRTLEASLPVSPGAAFAVENLAGTLTVGPASHVVVRVKVTVHAESDELAASLSIATVTGKDGIPTLRVAYPVDRHTQFRYPPRGAGSDSNVEYAGAGSASPAAAACWSTRTWLWRCLPERARAVS